MATNERYRYGSGGSDSEDDVSLDGNVSPQEENEIHPAFGVRKPSDPRSGAYHKYNIFSRLLFL